MSGFRRIFFSSFFLITYSVCLIQCHTPCAYFNFPTLTGNKFTTDGNSAVDLLFSVLQTCTNVSTITITKENDGSTIRCMFRLGETCQSADNSSCRCPEDGTDLYHFHLPADPSNNGTWVWSAKPAVTDKYYIDILLTEPARITDLTVAVDRVSVTAPTAVSVGSKVDIVCSWDNGDSPPRHPVVRLTGWDGTEKTGLKLTETTTSRVHYEIAEVRCQDAGTVTCTLEGAADVRRTTLLVRCRPEFGDVKGDNLSVHPGKKSFVQFPVKMHSPNITSCRLSRLSSNGHSNSGSWDNSGTTLTTTTTPNIDCLSFSSVSGTPPDLTLTIQWPEVTSQTAGQWMLRLANELGDSTVDFSIHVSNGVPPATPINPEGNGDTSPATVKGNVEGKKQAVSDVTQFGFLLLGAGTGGVFLLVVVVSVMLVVVLKRMRGGPVAPPLPAPNNDRQAARAGGVIFQRAPPAVHLNRDSQLSDEHIYQDIEDDEDTHAQGNSRASGAAPKPDSKCDGDSNHTVTSSSSSDIEWIIGSLHTLVFTSSASGSDWVGDCISTIAITSSPSDSEWDGDCLSTIAIASSPSDSESDDYLHPVPSAAERASDAHQTATA